MKYNNERDELIINNMMLAYRLAHDFKNKYSLNIDIEDLCSMATIGLCNAARLYNPDKEIKFNTYAGRAIWNTIIRQVQHSGEPKVPILSLESSIFRDNDFIDNDENLEGLISDGVDIAEECAVRVTISDIIERRLNESEKKVIRYRYFANGKQPSQIETAKHFGISKQRVSSLEKQALDKIKMYL